MRKFKPVIATRRISRAHLTISCTLATTLGNVIFGSPDGFWINLTTQPSLTNDTSWKISFPFTAEKNRGHSTNNENTNHKITLGKESLHPATPIEDKKKPCFLSEAIMWKRSSVATIKHDYSWRWSFLRQS